MSCLRSAVGIGVALTVACGGTLPHPPYIPQPQGSLVAVDEAPPPARLEYVPARPKTDGAVWVDGEWAQRRGRWAWKPGRWLVVPPGVGFSPWVLVRGVDGTPFFAPGVFRAADGKVLDDPPALVAATVGTVGVVEADGMVAVTGRTIHGMEAPAKPAK